MKLWILAALLAGFVVPGVGAVFAMQIAEGVEVAGEVIDATGESSPELLLFVVVMLAVVAVFTVVIIQLIRQSDRERTAQLEVWSQVGEGCHAMQESHLKRIEAMAQRTDAALAEIVGSFKEIADAQNETARVLAVVVDRLGAKSKG